jgi:hypothetical protein
VREVVDWLVQEARARSLLERLYPEMSPAWLEHTIEGLAGRRVQSLWHDDPRP